METLIQKEEQIKPFSEYTNLEIIDSIYKPHDDNNLDQELNTLIFQKEKEAEALEKLINSSEKQVSNPRLKKQIHNFNQKLEETKLLKQRYAVYRELNLYHLEGGLDLESNSVEFLVERYRLYQTILQSLYELNYNPAGVDILAVMEVYHDKIIEIITETRVDKKYGFGTSKARPMSVEKLSHLILPDTENPEFDRYQERTSKIAQGNTRLLTDGQIITMQDDIKGSESERIVTEELVQVPGVLATIDIPKFSIGDTRHKADTIAITLNPELINSISDKEIQLAVYKLIEEYRVVLLENMIQQGKNSLIDPKDNVLGDIIRINRQIKLDDIDSDSKEKDIDLSQILRMHKIQVKTQASEMSRAAESYKTSKMAVDADKVGFLAREYHNPGNPEAEDFNKIHFQIAAQTVLGLPIK
jgi:hypothetical protein